MKSTSRAAAVLIACAWLASAPAYADDNNKEAEALFVQGRKVADLLDKASLPEGGWLGGILVASRDTPAAATATYFEERDLSR